MVWGIPADELSARLAKGDYAILAPEDLASQDPGQAFSLSPEAPFYLSFVFDTIDRPAQSLRMLEAAWSRSPSPWREEAGILLAQKYVSRKDYGKAIDVARHLLASAGTSDREQRARRVLVEGLYWSREDAPALEQAARLAAPDPEVLLFRAVSSLRLGLDTARGLMMQLFIREKTSTLHGRAYAFLVAEPAYLQLFSVEDQGLMTARNAFVQGDWAKGIPLMENTLGSMDPSQLADGVLVVDLGNAYGYAGQQAAGAKYMEKLAVRLTGGCPRAIGETVPEGEGLHHSARPAGSGGGRIAFRRPEGSRILVHSRHQDRAERHGLCPAHRIGSFLLERPRVFL